MFKLLVYYFDEYQNEENEKAMSRGDQKDFSKRWSLPKVCLVDTLLLILQQQQQ